MPTPGRNTSAITFCFGPLQKGGELIGAVRFLLRKRVGVTDAHENHGKNGQQKMSLQAHSVLPCLEPAPK